MGGHTPSEEVENDDMEFLTAARKDDKLVAHMLVLLSRSEMPLPWRRHLLAPSKPPSPGTEGVTRPLLPPETRWGRRGTRSRSITTEGILAAKREEEATAAAAAAAGRRGSPTTPLSWSGGSGSVCGDGCPDPSQPTKRRRKPSLQEQGESCQPRQAAPGQEAKFCDGGEWIPGPPAKRPTAELYGDGGTHGDSLVRVPAPSAAFFSDYGSRNKAVEAAVGGPETSRTAAQVEPLRLRWTGSGSGLVGFRRPGKKKTVAELHALEKSLSQEQEELQKELEKHKEIYHALLEENMKLKKVESRLAPHVVSKRTATYVACEEETNREWPQHVESTSESQTVDELSTVSVVPEEDRCEQLICTSSPVSMPGRTLLLDLNCLPDEYV